MIGDDGACTKQDLTPVVRCDPSCALQINDEHSVISGVCCSNDYPGAGEAQILAVIAA